MAVAFRWNFQSMGRWPADLRQLDIDSRRAVGTLLNEILDEMIRRSLWMYERETFGSREFQTRYTGAWGAGLRKVTRGTGLTEGRAFGIIASKAPHAINLAQGKRSNDLIPLTIWLRSKMGVESDRDAYRWAVRLANRAMVSPRPDIFQEALGPASDFQIWADTHFMTGLDRILARGGSRA